MLSPVPWKSVRVAVNCVDLLLGTVDDAAATVAMLGCTIGICGRRRNEGIRFLDFSTKLIHHANTNSLTNGQSISFVGILNEDTQNAAAIAYKMTFTWESS